MLTHTQKLHKCDVVVVFIFINKNMTTSQRTTTQCLRESMNEWILSFTIYLFTYLTKKFPRAYFYTLVCVCANIPTTRLRLIHVSLKNAFSQFNRVNVQDVRQNITFFSYLTCI